MDWVLETAQDWWAVRAYRTWFMDEPSQEDLDDTVEKFEKFNSQIAAKLTARGDNARFVAGEKLTIADFVTYSIYLSFGSTEFSQKNISATTAAKVVEKPVIVAYMERMRAELAEYVEDRK